MIPGYSGTIPMILRPGLGASLPRRDTHKKRALCLFPLIRDLILAPAAVAWKCLPLHGARHAPDLVLALNQLLRGLDLLHF